MSESKMTPRPTSLTRTTKALMRKKAVAVARDVLKQIRARRVQLWPGVYLYRASSALPPIYSHDEADESLQKFLPKLEKECTVCLLGACLLSKARLYNEVPIGNLFPDGHYPGVPQMGQYVPDQLLDVFDPISISLMETVFERKNYWYRSRGLWHIAGPMRETLARRISKQTERAKSLFVRLNARESNRQNRTRALKTAKTLADTLELSTRLLAENRVIFVMKQVIKQKGIFRVSQALVASVKVPIKAKGVSGEKR